MNTELPAGEVKPPLCKSAITALVLFCVPFVCVILICLLRMTGFDLNRPDLSHIEENLLLLTLFCFIASTVVGLFAVFRIKTSATLIRGKNIAKSVVIASTALGLVLFGLPYSGRVKPIALRVICGTNLKGLANAIMIYANDYDDALPGESWCDNLIEHADISPKSLICPASDLIEGECSYAINKHILKNKLSELPPDIVLLFETKACRDSSKKVFLKERPGYATYPVMQDLFSGDELVSFDHWNQAAGPEAMSTAHHQYRGCNVLFADGQSKYIIYDELSSLKWSIDEPGLRWTPETIPEKMKNNRSLYHLAWIVLIGCVALSLSFVKKGQLRFCFLSWLSFSIVEMIAGQWFETAVYSFDFPLFGYKAGFVWGGIAGLVFTMGLIRLAALKSNYRQYTSFGGILLGIGCGFLINFTLIVFHNHFDIWSFVLAGYGGLAVGAPMGILLGNVYDPKKGYFKLHGGGL